MEKLTLQRVRFAVVMLIGIGALLSNIAGYGGLDGRMSVNLSLIGGIIGAIIIYFTQNKKP